MIHLICILKTEYILHTLITLNILYFHDSSKNRFLFGLNKRDLFGNIMNFYLNVSVILYCFVYA